VDHGVDANRQLSVTIKKIIRHRAAETALPALDIEPQQMLAIVMGFAKPHFADDAFEKNLSHRTSGIELAAPITRTYGAITAPSILRRNIAPTRRRRDFCSPKIMKSTKKLP
jgi:hypothetical protein